MAYRPEGLSTGLDAGETPSPAARPQPGRGPDLDLRGWLRWSWRQLTSMRVALFLLMLLAVVAIPGALFPQQPQDPVAVQNYHVDHPQLAPWLDRLGFFDVYASVWFSAVYILLFISLIGCIVPRIAVHARALRAAPPRVPRNFRRFAVRDEITVVMDRDRAETTALAALRGGRLLRRYRAHSTPSGITAERGYVRETGNIVFHLALLGILLSFAAGQLVSYRGQAIVVEGRGFANAVVDYDSFTPGTFFDPGDLQPFSFTLDSFESVFTADALAREFVAHVTVTDPDGESRAEEIRVNHPLEAGGANVYLQGNGYAPRITVRDAEGEVALSQAVPFLPEDGVYTSRGVVKVPDVSPGLDQLGFTGFLLPTAVTDPDAGGIRSVHPQPNAPMLVLQLYTGDLGLDEGVPQNVYELDTEDMEVVTDADGVPAVLFLEPGQTLELPDGLGSIEFEDLPRFVALDLRFDPTLGWLLASAIAALVGLMGSLFVPRRRLWVTFEENSGGGTVVRAAALARGEDPGLRSDLDRVLRALDHGHGADATTTGDSR